MQLRPNQNRLRLLDCCPSTCNLKTRARHATTAPLGPQRTQPRREWHLQRISAVLLLATVMLAGSPGASIAATTVRRQSIAEPLGSRLAKAAVQTGKFRARLAARSRRCFRYHTALDAGQACHEPRFPDIAAAVADAPMFDERNHPVWVLKRTVHHRNQTEAPSACGRAIDFRRTPTQSLGPLDDIDKA
jgi:hypothetical protein